MNIQGLLSNTRRGKATFLNDLGLQRNAKFICLTETWLTEDVDDPELTHDTPGYNILRCDRSGRAHGLGR